MILYDDPNKSLSQKQVFYYLPHHENNNYKYLQWAKKAEDISEFFGKGYCTIRSSPSDRCYSDQESFWIRQFPAIVVYSGDDSFYHGPGDNLNNKELNLTYALETVSTCTTLAALAADLGKEGKYYCFRTTIMSKIILFQNLLLIDIENRFQVLFRYHKSV